MGGRSGILDEVLDGVTALVVVTSGSSVVVGSITTTGVHPTSPSRADRVTTCLIRTRHAYSRLVFGPLNGVRLALVISAAVAGVVAMFAGFAVAGIVLLVGVALHGAGWLYLYSHRYPDTSD